MVLGDHHIDDAAVGHIGSRIIMRDDRRPIWTESIVAVRMVEVPVGIDDIINTTATELSDRGFYPVSQFG